MNGLKKNEVGSGPKGPGNVKERRRLENLLGGSKKGEKINRKLLMKHSFLKKIAAARLSSLGTANTGLVILFVSLRVEVKILVESLHVHSSG